jgi:hypothetical protein
MGIDPATFRFVVHFLNHCATAYPLCYTVRSDSRCAIRLRYVRVQACIDARGHQLPTPFISAQ